MCVVDDIVSGPLTLQLLSARVSPDIATQVRASGGKFPYQYDFAFKGNHSAGVVEAATGAYTPGLNANTTDTVRVIDATGTVSTLVIKVGPTSLNHDGHDDFALADAQGRMFFVDGTDLANELTPHQFRHAFPKALLHNKGADNLLLVAVSGARLALLSPAGNIFR